LLSILLSEVETAAQRCAGYARTDSAVD